MKPGNLYFQGAKSGGRRKMRIRFLTHIEFSVCVFALYYIETERNFAMEKRLFTSECVTCGHPDKVADAISDAILDACLAQDAASRVACETMVTTNFCLICGEITTKAQVDYPAVAREAIRKIGYVYPGDGFDADTVEIQCRIHTQSADIALGTNDEVGGAGDQGMMFGGACTQTPELMPLPIALSRALANRLTECVRSNDLLRADGKTQVSVEFDEAGKVVGIDTVVVSIMHSADFEIEELRKYIRMAVIAPVLEKYGFSIENVAHIHTNTHVGAGLLQRIVKSAKAFHAIDIEALLLIDTGNSQFLRPVRHRNGNIHCQLY